MNQKIDDVVQMINFLNPIFNETKAFEPKYLVIAVPSRCYCNRGLNYSTYVTHTRMTNSTPSLATRPSVLTAYGGAMTPGTWCIFNGRRVRHWCYV